jgi:flagellar basal body-associated protein FliL
MNKLTIIFAIVALVAGAGITFFLMQKGAKASEKPAEKPKVVSVIALEERTVNLADTKTAHYLRVVLELDVVGEHAVGEGGASGGHGGEKEGGGGGDKYKARLMDKLILTVGRQHFNVLLTTEGKEHLKEELKKAFNEVFKEEKVEVEEIFFTDFVME